MTRVHREVRIWCERAGEGYMKTTPEWPANRSVDYVTVLKSGYLPIRVEPRILFIRPFQREIFGRDFLYSKRR